METSGCIRSKKCKTDGDKETSHSNGETILKRLQTKKRSCPPMTAQTTSPNELNSGRKYVAFSIEIRCLLKSGNAIFLQASWHLCKDKAAKHGCFPGRLPTKCK